MQRFRGWPVLKAYRLLYCSTLGLRINNEEEERKLTREALVRATVDSPGQRFDPKQCIHEMVLESQLPHRVVNLLFTITNENNKLTMLWGTDFLEPSNRYIL